ncbi:hypothetical protein ACL1IE_13995, partial [Corynebacterium striatum]
VTDDYAEFFTDHDGEKLFSFPLPIQLNQRPPGGQININHVVGDARRYLVPVGRYRVPTGADIGYRG